MIVVDTHAVIWLSQKQDHLSEPALRAAIEGRQNGGLAIADITLREIAMLVTRGRVRVSTPLNVYLEFIESLFKVLPIDARTAEQSMRFGRIYPRDPADRLIGATAVVHGAKLITKDEEIRASREVDCIW